MEDVVPIVESIVDAFHESSKNAMRDNLQSAHRQREYYQNQVQTIEQRIAELQNSLKRAESRALIDIRQQMTTIIAMDEIVNAHLAKDGRSLAFETDYIVSDLLDDYSRRQFGKFLIVFNVRAPSSPVGPAIYCLTKWQVQDRFYKRSGRYVSPEHPHIDRSGYGCMGTARGPLINYLRSGDWDAAMAVAVSFLSQGNEGHGYPLDLWIRADEPLRTTPPKPDTASQRRLLFQEERKLTVLKDTYQLDADNTRHSTVSIPPSTRRSEGRIRAIEVPEIRWEENNGH